MRKSGSTALRAVIFLAALAVLSASLLAGTVAKYITKEGNVGSASVSKFGVVLRVSDDSMFETSYNDPTDDFVSVSSTVPVVAPGTKDNGVVFSITGTPEVNTHVTVELKANNDVFLKKEDDSIYTPLVFTLTQVGDANGDLAVPVVLKSGTLAEVAAWLESYSASENAYHNAGTNLKSSFRLSWNWSYEVDEATDAYDTTLGNIAADKATFGAGLTEGVDYSITVDYQVTITVAQVN